jgi:aryl-alcohol dehydrogenase-like predicted oxidoreductase/chorismate mutase
MPTDPLTELRREIDRVDASVVAALALRRRLVGALAEVKRDVGLAPLDPGREAEVRAVWLRTAAAEGLPADLALAVLDVVLGDSRARVTHLLTAPAASADGVGNTSAAPRASERRHELVPVERQAFGRTGLVVPRLGLGTGQLGELPVPDATGLLDHAMELGACLFDTAPSYGTSEERLAAWLRTGPRARAVISTKVGYGVPGVADWTGEAVARGIERAARLFGGYVDLVHLHSCPGATALRDDVQEALRRALELGLVRVAAYSGENEDLDAALASPVFGSVQVSLSLVDQGTRALRLPDLARRGVGVLVKRALGNAPWAARAEVGGPEAEYVARFRALALAPSADGWSSFALRFAAFTPGVHAVLLGTRVSARLEEAALALARGPLPHADVAAVEEAWRIHGAGWRGIV